MEIYYITNICRGRIVPTRSKTTQTPSNKTDRTRRPSYNRSKSRFSTTTEDYRETSYEPTKGKIPETTQKYNAIEHRRPTSRPQKYRNRDKANSQLVLINLSFLSFIFEILEMRNFKEYPLISKRYLFDLFRFKLIKRSTTRTIQRKVIRKTMRLPTRICRRVNLPLITSKRKPLRRE